MARKRQRAKDRKQKLHRENIPGSLDHASGEVEEVEAAIVAGAGGKPVEPAPDGVAEEPVDALAPDDAAPEPADAKPKPTSRRKRGRTPAPAAEPVEPEADPVLAGVGDDHNVVDDDDYEGTYGDDADAATVEHGRLGKGAGDLAVTPDAHKPAGFRVTNFIRACWAELQRVDWPDRRQVGQATAVVLGFVVVAGAFLGLADVVAQRIVDFII
jgi:preprotein translocase SecE subunit